MSVLDWLSVLLVVTAVLPVVTAFVLMTSHAYAESAVLRERAHLAVLLAALAVVVALLALNRLLGWGLTGQLVVLPLAVMLLLVDVASGRWLWQFWVGDFVERGRSETVIERQDREVGDERRKRQDDEEGA